MVAEIHTDKTEDERKRGIDELSFSTVDDEEIVKQIKRKKLDETSEKRLMEDVLAMSKILTQPTDTSEESEENTENNEILNAVRKLIGCFQPAIRECPDIITEGMIRVSKTFPKQKKEIFKITILSVTDDATAEVLKMDIEKNDYDIEQLCNILYAEIMNRMSRMCTDCHKYYSIGLDEEIKIICKVGKYFCTETIPKDDLYILVLQQLQ